ncbi:la-related protein 1B-like [Hibiscus syriacus]|uniref:la-related protein 1B-like n=1 Tax=Hibiscus syriacus TaxID=106335 RepID=UPI001924AC9A|nr:la-related protein 1B-like [Hibiscus syriacus]
MAMTADSSSPHKGLNNPQFRHNNLRKQPWAQVVASLPEQSSFSDCSPSQVAGISLVATEVGSDSDCNNIAPSSPKKSVWNNPSNVVSIGADSEKEDGWPALTKSAKGFKKSLTDSPPKTPADRSLSTPPGPVVPQSTHKEGAGSANPKSTPNRSMVNRQKSSKRSGNSSASGHPQGGYSHQLPPPPPPLPPFTVSQIPPTNFVPAMPYNSTRDPQYRGNSWETRPVGGFASQSHNDRHSSRRGGNYGPRGDGYNNWGRRDPDRGNYGNARDGHMQPLRAPQRGFPRPSLSSPAVHSFVTPHPVASFMNPIGGYPEAMYFTMAPFRGMPAFTPAPPPMFVSVPDPPLPALLLHQIDYYFSDDNLVKDDFLKSNMDDQGWVAISLIAGFPRVKSLTSNIQLIVDSLRSSTIVEVQDDKVRRCNDWSKWIPYRVSTTLGSMSPGISSSEVLASSFRHITIREESTNPEDTSGRLPRLSIGGGSEDLCLDQN